MISMFMADDHTYFYSSTPEIQESFSHFNGHRVIQDPMISVFLWADDHAYLLLCLLLASIIRLLAVVENMFNKNQDYGPET